MAKKFGGRTYKKADSAKRPSRKERPEREDKEEKKDYKGGGGRDRGRGRGRDEDNGFIHVTGLFESRKGGSYTVFIKEEMIEKLADLQEDDLLGVSESKQGMSLWIKKADK